jgi:methylthioribose-1-phosphate isomerase
MVKPVEWRNGKLRFMDQTKLPVEEVYVETDDPMLVASAIKILAIRGAPLIGIAAAYGVALAAVHLSGQNGKSELTILHKAFTALAATRPTAINLFWALSRQRRVMEALKGEPVEQLQSALLAEARRIHQEDEAMCTRIGELGEPLLPNAASVLTHCNTGFLATGGSGTAQSIILRAWKQSRLKHVYVDETRPLLQGARLTAWELQKLGIPCTLITDNTAAFLMQRGMITVAVVGADRIARNGDTANKVGTYNVAVLAHHHSIPFYVAAPTSSIDFETLDGKMIPIEQRSEEEIVQFGGKRVAPENIKVYSPAFDITPNSLITAIITEKGVVMPPFLDALKGDTAHLKSELSKR